MAGALSTLGLGSQGVLTNDIIDQLREADESAIIKPIENKIELANSKQSTLNDIKKLITELNREILSLSEPSLYQNRDISINGNSIKVEASPEAKEQSFDLEVVSLATRSINESTIGYQSKESTLTAQTLTINGVDIVVESTDTLEDLVAKIDEKIGDEVQASILNVGGDDPYKLILKSTSTGVDSKITTSSSGDLLFSTIGSDPVDATFKLDGVSITRSNNRVDDLIDGVTIELEEVGKSSVKITQDGQKVVEELENFTTKYNELIEKLSSVTKYDSENKSAGIFQGASEIRVLTSTLNNIVGSTVSEDGKTVSDFGLKPQRGGKIEFDKESIEQMLIENPDKVKDFLMGTDGENGLFNKMEQAIFDISISSSGALKSLGTNIENSLKSLEEEQSKAKERLDDRYKILQKRFASFDSVIGRLSSQSNILSSMIDAQFAKKN